MEQHPTKNELYDIYLAHHPTEQELETYKANWNYVSSFESMLEVTELKLEATKAVPTVLEETMSVVQLFESGSPLWVKSYSISELCFSIGFEKNQIKGIEKQYAHWYVSKGIARSEKSRTRTQPEKSVGLYVHVVRPRFCCRNP